MWGNPLASKCASEAMNLDRMKYYHYDDMRVIIIFLLGPTAPSLSPSSHLLEPESSIFHSLLP